MGVWLVNEKDALPLPPSSLKKQCAFSGAAGKRECVHFLPWHREASLEELKGTEGVSGCCTCFSDRALLLEHVGV